LFECRNDQADERNFTRYQFSCVYELINAVVTVAADANTTSADADEDDFFTRRRVGSAAPGNPTDALTQYMQMASDETATVAAWPELKDLFLRLNTPLPASAAAERLFSCAGLTMTNRRTNMTDELFEDLVLLKKNK